VVAAPMVAPTIVETRATIATMIAVSITSPANFCLDYSEISDGVIGPGRHQKFRIPVAAANINKGNEGGHHFDLPELPPDF
jgi:hypothetical protein